MNYQSFEAAWTTKNYGQAFEIATKLDDAGNPAGAYGLGLAYHTGNGADIDEDKAFDSFKKAASLGYGPAQLKLGQAYYHGTGALAQTIGLPGTGLKKRLRTVWEKQRITWASCARSVKAD